MAEPAKLPAASFVAELQDSETPLSIELEPLDGRRFRARIDDRELELEVVSVGPHSFSVSVGDRVREIGVTRREKSVMVSGPHGELTLQLVDRRRYRASGGSGGAAGQREIKAVMPGKVVSLLVKVGDAVEKDQPLLVLEAMKMENEVRSPRAGVVKEILVTASQTVETGELMIALE